MRAARAAAVALAAVALGAGSAASASTASSAPLPMYRGTPWPANATARALAKLAEMAQADKFTLIRGSLGLYIGNVPGNATLSLPALNLEDGPQGVADETLFVTAWPSAMTVAMAWNASAAYAFGRAMGEEQYGKGTNIALAPAVNVLRVPWNGRAFEYLSEEPFLASRVSEQEVLGIQSLPLLATAKHWVLNQIENDRTEVSSNVDRRTFMELYVPPFAAMVDAGVGSFMCAYDRVNGTWACENNSTMTEILRGKLGFRGFAMSDWTATHTAVASARAGLDMEMPQGVFYGLPLELAVDAGLVPASRIDEMVVRILTALYALGVMDDPQDPAARNVWSNVTSGDHAVLARELAEQSITLLKNANNTLPLDAASITSIAVLGDETTVLGGGSGGVIPPYVVTPTQGIRGLVGPGVNVSTYAGQDPIVAAQLAAAADVVVVSVAISSSEGSDRPDLSLPPWQDALVSAALAANPRTVVVVRCPGACFMPWAAQVPAILYQLMPGQESGNALARALFGLVNPSGKLPVTFPRTMNSTWLSPEPNTPVPPSVYPGTDRGKGYPEADYAEGLLVGYRYYDALAARSAPKPPPVTPLFPFGHGLSYTAFSYGAALSVNGSIAHDGSGAPATVSVDVSNTGPVAGAEVVQLYLGFPAALGEPPKVLRGFAKVALAPAESARVSFTLRAQDAAVFDVVLDAWTCSPGGYAVYVGSSSQDIRLTGAVEVV